MFLPYLLNDGQQMCNLFFRFSTSLSLWTRARFATRWTDILVVVGLVVVYCLWRRFCLACETTSPCDISL